MLHWLKEPPPDEAYPASALPPPSVTLGIKGLQKSPGRPPNPGRNLRKKRLQTMAGLLMLKTWSFYSHLHTRTGRKACAQVFWQVLDRVPCLDDPVHGQAPLAQVYHTKLLRGSKASRTASPMKISRLSMSEMTKKPVMAIQGA